jgi:BolA protein
MRKRIESKLATAFSPQHLEVIDESHRHSGHSGGHGHAPFDGGGGTHFRVRMISEKFATMSRLARHRAVQETLKEELADGVHALALELAAPGEQTRRMP